MPSFVQDELAANLLDDLNRIQNRTRELSGLTQEQLNFQPQPDKWSIAQVIAHLNYYNSIYIPLIEKTAADLFARNHVATGLFRSGLVGNWFTRILSPREDGTLPNKMKAPKGSVPLSELDGFAEIRQFMETQAHFRALLEKAQSLDWNRGRIPVSISRFIKLKTGDTFRFLIGHQLRHFVQIAGVLKALR